MAGNMNIAVIESLDHEGRGVAHVEGKAIFIEGALPGERVSYSSFRRKPTFENARADTILKQLDLAAQCLGRDVDCLGGMDHATVLGDLPEVEEVFEIHGI